MDKNEELLKMITIYFLVNLKFIQKKETLKNTFGE